MSIARGILSGYLKEGLEQKAARDEMYADMVKETGQEFRKTAALFRQDEKNIEKRFNLISAAHGPNAALYASYNGLTTSDAGTNLVINTLNEDPPVDYTKPYRMPNEKDPFAKYLDKGYFNTGTQATRPDLDLPALSSGTGSTTISPSDMRQFRSSAFSEFKAMEKDEFMKEFKDTFAKGYDSEKHGPSKDLYSFEKYFNEFYLPGIIGNKSSNTMDTQMENMAGTGTTTETGTATEGAQTTDAATTSTPFEGDVVDYTSDNPKYFSYNGKLYNVPERFITKTDSNPKAQELLDLQNERRGTDFTLPEFTVQNLPEITKKAIAAQQDKEPANQNNANVLAAQQAINQIRAQNPNDPRIDDIKRDLRLILGVTNLDGLIS